ncbi:MAG: DUF1616 domain-containing protein [Thermoplasmata archaeon]
MALPPQFFRRSYLFLLTLLTGIYAVVVLIAPTPWVDLPLGLLTLLIVPGYAVGALAFGAKPRWPWSLTFALVVGLSVAFNVAMGLILLEFKLGLPAPAFAVVSLVLLLLATVVWIVTQPVESGSRFTAYLGEELRLPGHSPAQQAVGYALLLGIVLVIVLIIYIASIFPAPAAQLSFGITGPGGTSANLPPTGNVSQVLTIYIVIGNNATSQTLLLEVSSAVANSSPSYTKVKWTQPLPLGNGTSSSEPLNLNASGSMTVHFRFSFLTRATYVLTFILATPSESALLSTSWSVDIT